MLSGYVNTTDLIALELRSFSIRMWLIGVEFLREFLLALSFHILELKTSLNEGAMLPEMLFT